MEVCPHYGEDISHRNVLCLTCKLEEEERDPQCTSPAQQLGLVMINQRGSAQSFRRLAEPRPPPPQTIVIPSRKPKLYQPPLLYTS